MSGRRRRAVERPTLETFLARKWVRVDCAAAPALCVVTRVEVAKARHALYLALVFRRIRSRALAVDGLLDTHMAFKPPRTLFFVSLWRSHAAMADFATAAPMHANVVGWARRRGARAWSGLFELRGASRSSDSW